MHSRATPSVYRPSAVRDAFYKKLQVEYAKRYPTYDVLSMRIMYNLSQTFSRLEAGLSARLLEYGMTFPGMNVLLILRAFGAEGCPLNKLGELLLVSRANITGIVDHVVRKKFAVREGHATDRRVILAKITPAGERWMDSYLPGHYEKISNLLSGLSQKEKGTLVQLLSTLRETSCLHPREPKRGETR